MSSTRTDTKRKRKIKLKSRFSFTKIFVCSMMIMTFMTLLLISAFFPSMIKFTKPEYIASFSFLSLFNTIIFVIFDE